jgi:uroporphyrinogen-III decarboxylase
MNSRERILNAIGRKAVDHVPLYLRLWDMGGGVDNFPFPWREQVARAESLLGLGVDDTLLLQPPLGFTEEYIADKSPGVSGIAVTRTAPVKAGDAPHLKKIYHTPDGDLSQVVKVTEDWPHGDDIMLFSDFNIPRQVEPLIKTREDIKRLRHLLASPAPSQVSEFRDDSRQIHREAERLGVALDGGWSALGDSAVWLCGMKNVLYWQMDQPEVLEELMDVLLEWELQRIGLLLEEGIDVMVHMAWYEGTDFWTPRNFRRIIRPRLQQIIDRVHGENVPLRYIITKGWKPLRTDMLEMGVDCVTGVDPVQDKLDLYQLKAEIGGQISLMGGMNAAVTLSMWPEKEIREAVDQAFEALSPENGFILFPVDNVFCELPWEKVELVIDQWKKHW